ncbi:MAG: acetyltransferase [Gemmatimonadales bacterium]
MSDRVLIWGAGGHGRVVRDVLAALGSQIVGFVDRSPPATVIVSGDGAELPCVAEEVLVGSVLPLGATALALGIGDNQARLASHARIEGRFPCPQAVHPSSVVGSGVRLGSGVIVMAGALVNANVFVGSAALINTGAVVEHDCVLEAGVHVGPGAVLCGGVSVGQTSLIGAGATVVPGIRIGRRATIGAGSVVVRDVADDEVVAGNPARLIRGKQ